MIKFLTLRLVAACYFILIGADIQAQTSQTYDQVPLNDLSIFKSPSPNWSIAGAVVADFNKPNTIVTKQGTGILVNIPNKDKNEDLFTIEEHGDVELDIDFIMPKNSNSGIYLQGRYEIQLFDSWGIENVAFHDLGGIYQRWDTTKPAGQEGFEGTAPRLNVAKAPGLWQNIKISFLAPKFDSSGNKTQNAKIVSIILNGVTIIENVELTGPTRGSAFSDESTTGPLRFQGDHGAVAFKKIQYNANVIAKSFDPKSVQPFTYVDKPVFVKVQDEPVILRSFVDYDKKRITHAANVGFKEKINYSYDLSKGALFQVWKGEFLDASPMWHFRGDGNTKALGSDVALNDAPSLSVILNEATWEDTLSDVGNFRTKGYELDGKGVPTFKYTYYGLNVEDKIIPSDDGKMLTRKLTLNGPDQTNFYYRIAGAKNILPLDNGMYSINDFEYYIQLPQDIKPVVRNSATGKELLIPVNKINQGTTFQYSIIW